ncbi:MAG TPA: hypothetical protein VFV38_35335 [Ktedonobacteraceae bacterium]|nr:hypothetical protein [Ktedonobacteraceae bacterium]
MPSPCHALLVHLNGNLPATTTCLDGSTTGQVSPAISVDGDCSIKKAVWIYWDANWQGACIGFVGEGRANLTDYDSCHSEIECYNWNDQASSFTTGCSGVDFFTDINAEGDWAYSDPYEGHNFPYQGVGNDQLSSIVILNNC